MGENTIIKQDNTLKTSYCGMIDVYRVIFTLYVTLLHFEMFMYPDSKTFAGGYLAVDFFFILSGFLVYKSWKSGKYSDAVEFTWAKIKRFFPYCIIVLGLLWIWKTYQYGVLQGLRGLSLVDFSLTELISYSYEIVFLQIIAPTGISNSMCWYLSALIVVGFILFIILEKNKNSSLKTGTILFFALVALAYIFGENDSINLTIQPTRINITFGLLRGFADMGIGCFISEISERVSRSNKQLMGMRILAIVGMALVMIRYNNSALDFVFIIFASLCVMTEFCDESLKKSFTKKVIGADYALALYICHPLIIVVWFSINGTLSALVNGNRVIITICFMVVECIFAYALEKIVRRINKR